MSFDVTPLLTEAQQAQQALLTQARRLADKWEQSGLLEGLDSQYDRGGMAVLLENQAGQLINEVSITNPGGTDAENWAGVALPLVRKVFGQIAAKNFVSVQPMNLPAGLVFFLDFRYNNTRFGQTANNSVYGNTSGSGDLPNDGLYGAGRFGYTVNDTQSATLSITAARTASATDVNFNSDSTGSSAVHVAYLVSGSDLPNADFTAVRSFQPSGSAIDFGATVLAEFTSWDPAAADGVGLVTFVAPIGGTLTSVDFSVQPTETARGDFEDRTGADIGIPEINIELRSEPIVAKTRKLKAVWSPELAQDLNAYHSVDAEAELTNMLSDYIATEVDYEILDMLVDAAQTTEYWSTNIGRVWDETTTAFIDDANIAGQAWTNMTWFQTLGQKMQKVSNRIHQLTLRGPANFAVVSPTVATILETIPGFAAGTDGTAAEFGAGISAIGSFQQRYTIYKNPYQTDNLVLMGFRGSQFLETGAVYAPYIPLIMTPLVLDPTNFTPRRGVMTRYAKKVVRPEFYGKIYIEGLDRL
ncbi:MAG: hypothetical protein VW683_00505 [Betaproteobacteria bacterium]|jgi:hypothetical protein